ncbi:pilus assembly PilX family protein [Undibacterium sp. Dicai25W]|uniref:pilus assembly PilX family protein n=1 Tax=Undibacterium sp. Dicai25W TaxID=3413034 RepID=UPI003BF22E7E
MASVHTSPIQRRTFGVGFRPKRQRGIILFVTLVALVILLISAVAMVRSFDTSLLLSGNLAFKRDLINQGERGVAAAITNLKAQAYDSLYVDLPAINYSATLLSSDPTGVPSMLTNDALWKTAGMAFADVQDTTSSVSIRFVIDRMCIQNGFPTPTNCIDGAAKKGGTANVSKGTPTMSVVYRISVRITGPRNTQSYMQSTVTM